LLSNLRTFGHNKRVFGQQTVWGRSGISAGHWQRDEIERFRGRTHIWVAVPSAQQLSKGLQKGEKQRWGMTLPSLQILRRRHAGASEMTGITKSQFGLPGKEKFWLAVYFGEIWEGMPGSPETREKNPKRDQWRAIVLRATVLRRLRRSAKSFESYSYQG
jgi:hypothetical protein